MTGPAGLRVLRFDGAFSPEGCGGGQGPQFRKKGSEVVVSPFGHAFGVRVLKFDRPLAGGFSGLTAAAPLRVEVAADAAV